jgi:hypothetical protein
MITVPHLEVRASRPGPAAPGASPALTPSRPDAVPLRSDRRPGLPLRTGLPGEDPAVPAQSRVPLRRKRPAGTQGGGDIDEPSVVTEGSRSIGNHAASEIDAPGPRLTPTCGGRTRRPRTEEWPLPDPHPRSQRQLGALDPRSPITEGFRPFSVAEHSPLTRGTGPGSLSEARLSPRLLYSGNRDPRAPQVFRRRALGSPAGFVLLFGVDAGRPMMGSEGKAERSVQRP